MAKANKLGDIFSPIYSLAASGCPEFKMLVDGKWTSLEQRIEVRSPIDDGLVATIPNASEREADQAVESSDTHRNAIRTVPAVEKIEIFLRTRELLLDNEDSFVHILSLEAGKTLANAKGEVRSTAERLKLTPGGLQQDQRRTHPRRLVRRDRGYLRRRTKRATGGRLSDFTFQLPTLYYLNQSDPGTSRGKFGRCETGKSRSTLFSHVRSTLEEAGLPAGTLNVVTGRGPIGEYLAGREKVDMISFTGSTEVGKRLARVAGIKKLHMELGGKGCAIVLGDADLDLAVKEIAKGSLSYSGQRCDAVSRVLVEQSIVEAFVEKIVEEAGTYKVGDPRDPTVKVGPLINRSAVERVHGLVTDAIDKGAKALVGAKFEGNYYYPTVLYPVPINANIMWEETFGPIIPVMSVKDVDEAIDLTNRSKYGLDSCVFTFNLNLARKVAKRLEEGEITINAAPRHGVGYYPFGGNKDSGLGREGIGYSIEEMTRLKTIVYNWKPARVWSDLVEPGK